MAERILVAVIDSGVHPDHPHINAARLRPGFAIGTDGMVIEQGAIPLDRLGHGTAVTAAIQEKAPEANILPIRVFHDALRGSAMALASAIGIAAQQGAHIINLSLGTTNAAHAPLFADAIAGAPDALVLAAAQADGVPCLPGSLPGVLGVGLDWDIPRETFQWRDGQMIASGYPRPIPGVPQRRNLYGISFAVAQASGFAAALAQVHKTPAALRAALSSPPATA
ncbi:subtilisin-like serine protease QhpE [Novosphingobium sediminicola]|uniref:Subtilisin family serine protease n=1 Tax=Novosphingobium sediminicola TaxID=563162 RepID=A0A7W6CE98_9SPHN|nr:S8 family serine peptidase [Novosphingobium sediminicola]MBB3954948.1 subtilisin family serine protease [Novosphingobium sediminicola]